LLKLNKTTMAYIETRMYTETEQIAIVQPNETDNGVVLITKELDEDESSRLYLSFDEAEALITMLQQNISRLKK
jgi:hypothetical protein